MVTFEFWLRDAGILFYVRPTLENTAAERLVKMASAEDQGILDYRDAVRRRDNYWEVFSAAVNTIRSHVHLESAKSCLAIGPGEGRCEVEFIEACAPNLRKLTVLEPDHKSVQVHLTTRLMECLPGVEQEVIECRVQDWNLGPYEPFDLVLIFNVLYYLSSSERKELFHKVHDRWLSPDGFLAVMSYSSTKSPGNSAMIYESLGSPILAWEDVEPDALEAGFVEQHAHELQVTRDYSDPDESFLRFFQMHVDEPVTLDEVRRVIQDLYPDGKSDQCFTTLAVFKTA